MAGLALTQKEKKTFYGLVKCPNHNDRALAEILDEKMSTVTSIRRRLRDRNFYTKIRVPRFQDLGYEILVICHGSFKPMAPHGTDVLSKVKEAVPTTFFGMSNPYHFVLLGVARNYTEARRTYDGYYHNPRFVKAVDEGDLTFSYLPFQMSEVQNAFDFGPLLKKVFGVTKAIKDDGPVAPPSGDKVELTPTEKKVFLGLVTYPEMADKSLAERIKVSRQAVSKMRKGFEREGLLRTAIIPNLAKLDLGMIIFTHYVLNPKRSGPKKENAVKERAPGFFSVTSPYESYSMSAFSTYQEYEKLSESYYKLHSESKILLRAPTMIPFSIEDVSYFRNHTYSTILKTLFGL